MPVTSREVRLVARPRGRPQESDFELAATELPDPGEGELLIRNAYVSVDPYMRGRDERRQARTCRRSCSARR